MADGCGMDAVAAHEAGHAAMCVTLGVPVRLVDTVPNTVRMGSVHHGLKADDRESALAHMMIVLAGPLMGDDEIPAWPLRDDATQDERHLHAMAKALRMDMCEYADLVHRTINVTLTREFTQLHAAITGMLDYQPQLGPDAIASIESLIYWD